ncbi:hypothetical protein [Moraxella catarrhalis]|uniref:hypothetical protein n=1 Tax=Moraxella catarrhalis TaxID=480 RepID=UPI001F5190BC|nr:hypothetical protein [Moraxella catarrhalis]
MNSSSILPRLWLGLCALLVLVPLSVIVFALNSFDTEIWQFLLDYELPLLLKNTTLLVLGVGIGVTVLGTTTAWLTAMTNFPLRRFFWLGDDVATCHARLCACFCAVGYF